MQVFIDTATQKIYHFENDVKVTAAKGIYTFTSARGNTLKVPATLRPYTPPAPTSAQILAAAQVQQNIVLGRACAKAIVSGFSSLALGTAHNYGSTTKDQGNLQSAAIAASSTAGTAAGWETPIWCADASGKWALVQHTALQAIQVHNDMLTMISAARVRLAALKASVAGESTVAAVQAITW